MDLGLELFNVEDHRASACVAPLSISKTQSRDHSQMSNRTCLSREGLCRSPSCRSQGRLSPPLTPRSSRDALDQQFNTHPIFHNYIRAFYPFHPTTTVSSSGDESSIVISINQGDVILVHSIHPNGWADGTLVADGSRGWLPTNYCEAYDPPAMHNLLTALTQLWDLVRTGENGDLSAFAKQDHVRGMIAGVRSLLDTCQCLTREDYLVQSNAGLRRFRKGMLADLSNLVKTAKQLQAMLLETVSDAALYDMLDELVFKALRLVSRAVRFLDLWQQNHTTLTQQHSLLSSRPVTPPKDSDHRRISSQDTHSLNSGRLSSLESPLLTSPSDSIHLTGIPEEPSYMAARRERHLSMQRHSLQAVPESRLSFTLPTVHPTAGRSSMSHRVSYTSKASTACGRKLALEQLCAAQDAFLGLIGSFIGLHLQSRSTSELLNTTKESVLACSRLLKVVDAVCEREPQQSEPLSVARTSMNARLLDLVYATKALFSPSDANLDDEVFIPDQGKALVDAATNCVRAAGDCVTRARHVIERIGDFEVDASEAQRYSMLQKLEPSHSTPPTLAEPAHITESTRSDVKPDSQPQARTRSPSLDKPLPAEPQTETETKPVPAPIVVEEQKPLPDPPLLSPLQIESPLIIELPTVDEMMEVPATNSVRSSISGPSQLVVPHSSQLESSPTDTSYSVSPAMSSSRFFGNAFRAGSINASVADSSSTYPNSARGDNASIISHTSTRATTPDHAPIAQDEAHPLKSFESMSELTSATCEDVEEAKVEAQLLNRTYVHELVYNKEGQISGGSLPALVEQLTLHDVTPDATFVTTFYLTFRLFTTPLEFASCLIDRFDYVGDSMEVGLPVRLRVFNVFKGWLESHWDHDTDHAIIPSLLAFANGKLQTSLPAASKRMLELTDKVTAQHAEAKSTQLTSSVGKTSTSIAVFSKTEKDAPAPAVSKSQLNLLKSGRIGAPSCSILDFDALELARQFTIIESKIFCDIRANELLALEWTKGDKSNAANVRAMSTLSTDLTNLVADSILCIEDPKKRALVIKRWIKIAFRCMELHNYDSLMAIICSLNSSMVLRLKKTWDYVSEKTKGRLEELKTVVDCSRNYAVLRQRLQNLTAPCIPFVGLYLTDLTFVDVGNRTKRQLPDAGVSVINFDKHAKTAKIIGQLQQFQIPYKLTPVPEMQEWINSQIQRVRTSEMANMKEYYRRSLMLEPREHQNIPRFITQDSNSSTVSAGTTPVSSTTKERFDFMGAFSFTTSSSSSAAPRKNSTSS